MNTESVSDKSENLDAKRPEEALAVLLAGQQDALASVAGALSDIARGAEMLAQTVRNNGKIAYAAAGSSGLMAMADGLELPGTFSIANDRIKILMAGGMSSLADMLGGTEDDLEAAKNDVHAAGIGAGDCLIGVSASGSTPYTLAAMEAASKLGARTIAIANNPDTPLLARADAAILLATPPEIVAGSTRMGAGTAQKAALNMMSTLMAMQLGHIYDGYMINVRADNKKLKKRAEKIVADIGRCSSEEASQHLESANGAVKTAIMLAAGADNIHAAEKLIELNHGHLRPALAAQSNSQ
ncbi:MAG: N-acetylmuramic acid 6-phosphate etherase [Rhizobiaceae bacterium]